MSDIEGKATRVAARMEPRGREQHGWANREVEWAGAHESKREQRTSFNYFPDTDSLYIDLSSRARRARKFLREWCWITTPKEI
jgi:hypothetical protein